MSEDDRDPKSPLFMLPTRVATGEGPISDEEISANVSNLSSALMNMARAMATQLMNRDGVQYHALVITLAVQDDTLAVHEVGHDGELPHAVWERVLEAATRQIARAGEGKAADEGYESGDDDTPPPGSRLN